MGEIHYPILVREKDDDTWFIFDAFARAQDNVEITDVENEEYEAWDALGRPLVLTTTDQSRPRHRTVQELVRSLWQGAPQPATPAKREQPWLSIRFVSSDPDTDPALPRRIVRSLGRRGIRVDEDTPLDSLIPVLRGVAY